MESSFLKIRSAEILEVESLIGTFTIITTIKYSVNNTSREF